jgi:hypothetical protein
MPECPICCSPTREERGDLTFTAYDCPRCGRWAAHMSSDRITFTFAHEIGDWDKIEAVRKRSRLSHILRRRQPAKPFQWAELPKELGSWHLEESLPSPSEQLDHLIILVGDNQPSPAQSAILSAPAISAWIGATITRPSSNAGLGWLLDQRNTTELVEKRDALNDPMSLRLSMAGWRRYEVLKQGRIVSRKVLMAMKFGDAELDHVVRSCFSPAVKRAGFELRTVIDDQPAGLIDDQLRVALRTSRFVIADLTHRNNGAYWEAGFAEGLGRPVIYTCREAEWKQGQSHFDTNHLVTVIWDPTNLERTAARLTATIMATLPEEANMTE